MKIKIRDMLLMFSDMFLVYLMFNLCYHYCRLYINAQGLYMEALGALIPIYFAVLFLFGTYRSLWQYAEAWEFLLCMIASVTAGAVYFIISRWVFEDKIPFYFYMLVATTTGFALVSLRLVYRVYRDYVMGGGRFGSSRKRVMIIGCGHACYTMLAEIKSAKSCDILPVVGIDDDPSKVGKRVNGLYIAGTTAEIEKYAKKI